MSKRVAMTRRAIALGVKEEGSVGLGDTEN